MNGQERDVLAVLTLEAENIIERLDEDKDSKLRWFDERESLLNAIKGAKRLLWPEPEQ